MQKGAIKSTVHEALGRVMVTRHAWHRSCQWRLFFFFFTSSRQIEMSSYWMERSIRCLWDCKFITRLHSWFCTKSTMQVIVSLLHHIGSVEWAYTWKFIEISSQKNEVQNCSSVISWSNMHIVPYILTTIFVWEREKRKNEAFFLWPFLEKKKRDISHFFPRITAKFPPPPRR